MPILNDFGQSFKASGYRTMGTQSRIESDSLSIPESLNASMLIISRYQRSNGGDAPGTLPGTTTNGGQWQFPDDFDLFLGGRISNNFGFYFEGNTASPTLLSAFKLPAAIEVNQYNLSVIPYLTDRFGASYGYEQASTGAVQNMVWAEHRKEVSAQQYVGTDGAATGVSIVAKNDTGYLNFSRWAPASQAKSGYAQVLHSNYLRVAATPKFDSLDHGEWALLIGAQFWTGSNFAQNAAKNLVPVNTQATALDFQAMGTVNDKDIMLYATLAKSPAGTAAKPNMLNVGSTVSDVYDPAEYRLNERTAFTVGADYSVIQNTLHVGAAFRSAKTGGGTGITAVTGVNSSDNAITLTAVYNLAQNIELHANHSYYYGSLYDTPQPRGNLLTTIKLQAAW